MSNTIKLRAIFSLKIFIALTFTLLRRSDTSLFKLKERITSLFQYDINHKVSTQYE